jgi:transcriptional regulator with XRE-family HTH domain
MITKKTQESLQYIEGLIGHKLTLGSFIMSIRQGEEETQVAFAQKLGVSRQVLCDIEHDRRFISPKKAAEYANLLGYPEKEFVRLCLQDLIDRDGLKLEIEVDDAA